LVYYTQWSGGYSNRISLAEKLKRNLCIKRRLYDMCSVEQKQRICWSNIEASLRLHWLLVALRQHAWQDARQIGLKSLFFPLAWLYWLKLQYQRRHGVGSQKIPKNIL